MISTKDVQIPGYAVGRSIAGGGMSQVYLAQRLADGLQVVVKLAPVDADAQARERQLRERHLLETVNDPHVIQLLDSGEVDGRPFLILEYVEGQSLRELIQAGRPLAWNKVVAILQQLSDALSALHEKGVLHRDVKPENVLLDKHGHVKLIDLGIGAEAAAVGRLTTQSQFVGTVDYMAPEQRHRLFIDQRTDQYSLAAMTFEMLTGHCSLGQFRRPSELNPILTPAIDRVLLKALERDPDDRFSSVDSFTTALVAARSESRRGMWIPAAAVFGAACLLIVASSVVGDPEPPDADPSHLPVNGPSAMAQTAPKGIGRITENSLGMKLAWIPAGRFQMGVTAEEIQQRFKGKPSKDALSESPRHKVTLTRPFWMGVHEVSVAQFRVFVEKTCYLTTSERQLANGRSRFQPVWDDPAHYAVTDNLPVCAISWEDAVAFCKWLSEVEDRTYRLPTEAEWEYACRAGSTEPWFCHRDELPDYAVHARPWRDGPSAIGKKLPNPWGLYDMHGNVWEWCQDYYDATFYEVSPETDPLCSQPPANGDYHVLRSGGYFGAPETIRSTRRRGQLNRGACTDLGHALGFRVVLDTTAAATNRTSG